jgi:hypothetical protein
MRNACLFLAMLMCGAVVPVQTMVKAPSHQDGNDLLQRCQQAVEAIDNKATWKNANESFDAGFCLGGRICDTGGLIFLNEFLLVERRGVLDGGCPANRCGRVVLASREHMPVRSVTQKRRRPS